MTLRRSVPFFAVLAVLARCGGGSADDRDAAVVEETDTHADADPEAAVEAAADFSADSAAEVTADAGDDRVADAVSDAGSDTGPCTFRMAVVADIDATLTTADTEWLAQIAWPPHDPAMRPDAHVLMQDYAALGYGVFYITARGEGLSLLDGTSAREATARWLTDHGFPYTPENLFLSDGLGAWGDSAADYKTGILEGLMADGWRFRYAYGNSDTDIEAFLSVGIPAENVFLVGDLAGGLGVSPVTNSDAYVQHIADHLPAVPEATCAAE